MRLMALNGAMAANRRDGFRGYTDRARRNVARQEMTLTGQGHHFRPHIKKPRTMPGLYVAGRNLGSVFRYDWAAPVEVIVHSSLDRISFKFGCWRGQSRPKSEMS